MRCVLSGPLRGLGTKIYDLANMPRAELRRRQHLWRYTQTNDNEVYQHDPELDALQNAERLAARDPQTALLEWCALAERGSVWSMFRAGWAHQNGEGVVADQIQAEYWYRLSFEGGCQQAQLRLGSIYWRRREFDRAEEVYGVGARENWTPALYYLAAVKLQQPKTLERLREARILLEKAAAQGDVEAQLYLASLMARGRFGNRLRPKGFYLLFSSVKEVVGFLEKNEAVSEVA